MGHYLERDADIVSNQNFENGLFKMMSKDFVHMTTAEKHATMASKKAFPIQSDDDNNSFISNKTEKGGYYEQLF